VALNKDAINIALHLHVNCVRNYATRLAIQDNFNHLKQSNFWRVVSNSALDITVIDWCKLFGAYKESTHFKNSTERGIQSLEKQVLNVCNTTLADYHLLHTSLLEYRDRSVAHVDINNWQVNVPYLSNAIELIYISFDIFTMNVGIKGLDIRQEFSEQYGETMVAIQPFIR
jgi:hypothetical protein